MELALTSEQLKVWLRINRLEQTFELDEIEQVMLEFLRKRKYFTPRQMLWLEIIEKQYGVEHSD